jgi:hypothetical protein
MGLRSIVTSNNLIGEKCIKNPVSTPYGLTGTNEKPSLLLSESDFVLMASDMRSPDFAVEHLSHHLIAGKVAFGDMNVVNAFFGVVDFGDEIFHNNNLAG